MTVSDSTQLKGLLKSYDLCVAGSALPAFLADTVLAPLLPKVKVFARVSPDQKVTVTLMTCVDRY